MIFDLFFKYESPDSYGCRNRSIYILKILRAHFMLLCVIPWCTVHTSKYIYTFFIQYMPSPVRGGGRSGNILPSHLEGGGDMKRSTRKRERCIKRKNCEVKGEIYREMAKIHVKRCVSCKKFVSW